MSASDDAVVAAQLGRRLRSGADVANRCHLGLPVVTRVPPRLDDGTPFPTRYWLTCPLARRRIGRLEAAGGVKAAEQRLEEDPEYAAAHEAAMARYAAERDALLPDDAAPRPSGGVGGTRRGVKCLHAHYADHAAGNANPVGAHTAGLVEPLDCHVVCVITEGGAVLPNPEWREPK
jgi:hypothetical protein